MDEISSQLITAVHRLHSTTHCFLRQSSFDVKRIYYSTDFSLESEASLKSWDSKISFPFFPQMEKSCEWENMKIIRENKREEKYSNDIIKGRKMLIMNIWKAFNILCAFVNTIITMFLFIQAHLFDVCDLSPAVNVGWLKKCAYKGKTVKDFGSRDSPSLVGNVQLKCDGNWKSWKLSLVLELHFWFEEKFSSKKCTNKQKPDEKTQLKLTMPFAVMWLSVHNMLCIYV